MNPETERKILHEALVDASEHMARCKLNGAPRPRVGLSLSLEGGLVSLSELDEDTVALLALALAPTKAAP